MEKTHEVDSASRARTFAVETKPMDWFLIILALEKKGYTHRTIAEATGCSRSAIGMWRCNDHEPSHPSGEALIQLWLKVTGQPRDQLPERTPGGSLSAARAK